MPKIDLHYYIYWAIFAGVFFMLIKTFAQKRDTRSKPATDDAPATPDQDQNVVFPEPRPVQDPSEPATKTANYCKGFQCGQAGNEADYVGKPFLEQRIMVRLENSN